MRRYISLTKPRIIILLAFTGVVGYLIPSLDNIRFLDLLVFIVCGYAAAGGGMTINNILDRDIDDKMERTKSRSSVGEDALPAENMFFFGVVLSVLGIILGFAYFGPYTALFLAWGNLFYIFGYSMYLKKKSVWNTLIGGFASPSPVLVGFAARYEDLHLDGHVFLGVPPAGWMLAGIVFFWSASHTFALAGYHIEDYTRAKVPMLPVVFGMGKASKITALWGLGLIIYANYVALYIAESWWILVVLIIPNLLLLHGLWVFYRNPTPKTAKTCFMSHNIWLPIVFISIVFFSWV